MARKRARKRVKKRPSRRPKKRKVRKAALSTGGFMTDTWQESFSLGAGLVFLSLLAFSTSLANPGGTLIFVVGLYFFIHGLQLKKKQKDTFQQWISFKVLQTFILIGLGIILMASLPATFFGIGFLIMLFGFLHFLAIKSVFFRRKR